LSASPSGRSKRALDPLLDPCRRVLLALFPWCRFSPAWRWALLPGRHEEEDATSYREETHRHLVAQHDRHGDIFVTRRRGQTILFVRSPLAVRSVLLSKDFAKVWVTDGKAVRNPVAEYVHNLVQPLLTDPIFSKKGASNVDAREMVKPLFLGSNLFASGFAAEVDAALASWPAGGEEVDVLTLVHEVIRRALYHAIAGPGARKLHAIATPAFHKALDYFVTRYQMPSHDQEVSADDEAMMSTLHNAAIEVVAAVRALHSHEPDAATALPKRTLLALMFDAECTDAEAAAVVVNTVIAGAEAPASALAHTLHELARQPDLMCQLHKEVAAAVAPGGDVAAVLDKLPLVKGCVLEGLRLFAPATLVKRQALCDTHVEGVAVPRGTVVELCVTAIHRDPKQYPQPLQFEPQRPGPEMAPVLGKARSFMPFSGGLRGCPGRPLALTIMRITLASIVQRFMLRAAAEEHAPEEPVAARAQPEIADVRVRKFILWPAAGVPLRLEKRVKSS